MSITTLLTLGLFYADLPAPLIFTSIGGVFSERGVIVSSVLKELWLLFWGCL